MRVPLLSYLPMDRRHALARGVALPDRTHGAALLADISGYTPLGAALARMFGPRRGAEELTAQINRVYDALIAEVDCYGGSVISFAGDAITCWFDDDERRTTAASDTPSPFVVRPSPASLRAVACALAQQNAMQQFAALPSPDGDTIPLALKVAVASGPARRFLVGDPAIQSLDALAGATIARMAAAEHLADKNEVLIDEPAAVILGDLARISRWRIDSATGERFGVLVGLHTHVNPQPWPSLDETALDDAQVRPWLLPAVYERQRAGLGAFLTELRPAVALFLRFVGLDYEGDDAAEAWLDMFIRRVQGVLARYEGTLLQLTIGDKGSYLYATFGAPTAHEDDAHRAILAALELRALSVALGFLQPIQIGIGQGTMRTGAYGSSARRTYGVLGDEVNLAARLMQAASPGEILVSWAARQACASLFRWELLPTLNVKGKAEPVVVMRLLERQQQAAPDVYDRRLIGRDAELERLSAALRPLLAGQFAGLVSVYGEPGIGKSRLVYELRQVLTASPPIPRLLHLSVEEGTPVPLALPAVDAHWARGPGGEGQVAWFTCPSEGMLRQSLHPFRHFLRQYFGQDSGSPAEANRARFDTALDQLIAFLRTTDDLENREPSAMEPGTQHPAPEARHTLADELERARAFLAALVDLYWDDSLYQQSEPKLRFENTLAAFRTLILAESRRQPVVLHLEDVHWLDDDSRALLRALMRNIVSYPFAVLLSGRYHDDGSVPDLPVDADVPQLAIDLNALPRKEIQALAAHVLGGEITNDLVGLLADKTGGNPFFVEQLALDLRERGAIRRVKGDDRMPAQPSEARAYFTLGVSALGEEMPASITAVLVARLDRLAAQVKAVVQTAAVLGQEFELRVLSWMLQDTNDIAALVGQAEAGAIWLAIGELRYVFRHAPLRDAAYGMHIRSRLHELHTLAGAAIEHAHATDLAAHYADLAYHYGKAEDVARERHYSRLAAQQAAARFANTEAMTYLSRALELTPESDAIGRYALLLERERVAALQGARGLQSRDLDELAALAERLADDRRRADVALRRAWYVEVTGDYQVADIAAQQVVALAQNAGATELEAAGYMLWGRALAQQGDAAAARARTAQALALALAAGLPALEADSLRNLGLIAAEQRDYLRARTYLEQSLDRYRATDDRQGQSSALANLGLVAAEQGDTAAAQRYHEQSLALCRVIGNRYGECIALLNLGLVAAEQDDGARARGHLEESLRLCRTIGDRWGESIALLNLGLVAAEQDDGARARGHLEESLRLCRAMGDQQGVGHALSNLGVVAHRQGDAAAAQRYFEEALNLRRQTGYRAGDHELPAIRSRIAGVRDDTTVAQAYDERLPRLALATARWPDVFGAAGDRSRGAPNEAVSANLLPEGGAMAPTILIVDDEPHIRMLIEQALEDLADRDVTLVSAANGEEALQLIKTSRPALIFLDVMMPRINGFDVCDAVKHELGMGDTYVVLLTAKGQVFDRQRGQEVGADTYMTKPFDPDQLLQTALDVLGIQ